MKKIIIVLSALVGLLFANEAAAPKQETAKVEKPAKKAAYEPEFEKVTIAGAEIYVLGDDRDEAIEEGQIDQYWFAELINSGKELPKNVTLVDLRTEERYKAEHIKGAVNITFDDKTEKMDLSKLPKDGVIVFQCRKGMKSINARTTLDEELAKRVFVFDAVYKCDDKYKNCTLTPNEAL